MFLIVNIVWSMLIPLGILSILAAIYFFKPPRAVALSILSVSWIAGLLNFIVDFVQQHYGFWHYTIRGIFLGYPLNLYIAVSLIVGGAISITFWRIRTSFPKWVLPFLFLLPAYLTLQDYVFVSLTGNQILRVENPFWWSVDFIALCALSWGTLAATTLSSRDRT
jgi:hypothetical protein